jgi:hypothetical protein
MSHFSFARLQFTPGNPFHKSSMKYTSQFDVRFKVQTRNLRKQHVDSHFCTALFKYLRAFAVQFRSHTSVVMADDKVCKFTYSCYISDWVN